jgi:thiol-disulfide isomerase/thioredoxin
MKIKSEKRTSTGRMILVFLLLGVALTWFFSQQFESLPTGFRPNLPPKLNLVGGPNIDLQERSKPLLVNFWATWCAPCLHELPVLVKVARDFDKEVQFIGLSVDSPVPDVLVLQRQFQIPYPLAIAPWEMVSEWKAEQLPMTYLLDKKREIVWLHRGAVSENDLVAAIKSVLAQTR